MPTEKNIENIIDFSTQGNCFNPLWCWDNIKLPTSELPTSVLSVSLCVSLCLCVGSWCPMSTSLSPLLSTALPMCTTGCLCVWATICLCVCVSICLCVQILSGSPMSTYPSPLLSTALVMFTAAFVLDFISVKKWSCMSLCVCVFLCLWLCLLCPVSASAPLLSTALLMCTASCTLCESCVNDVWCGRIKPKTLVNSPPHVHMAAALSTARLPHVLAFLSDNFDPPAHYWSLHLSWHRLECQQHWKHCRKNRNTHPPRRSTGRHCCCNTSTS